MGQMVILT